MSAENGKFRSCLFGGFARGDVVAYIKKLAEERNACKAREEKLLDRIDALERELEQVKEDSTHAIRAAADAAESVRLSNEEILQNTRSAVTELETRFEDMAGKLRASASSLQAQYGIFRNGINDLLLALDTAENEINTLKAETFGTDVAGATPKE